MRASLLCLSLLLPLSLNAQNAASPTRIESGNRISENVPEIPAELIDRLNRTRTPAAPVSPAGPRDGCLLISTRFAETAQAHRVCQPMGMREQLTFYPEPVAGITPAPAKAWRDGFVFAKDKGGDEFRNCTGSTTPPAPSHAAHRRQAQPERAARCSAATAGCMAYTSTARNGTDRDVWVRDTQTGAATPLVTAGGSWSAMDFSPDGKTPAGDEVRLDQRIASRAKWIWPPAS